MRQQLKEVFKWVSTGHLWNRMGWEQIDTWQHPQTTSSCCRRQLPCFCAHVPQESGTRVGVSLSEKWPKRPRHANKNFPLNSAKDAHDSLVKLWVNWVHKKIRWRGLAKVLFEWKVLKFWTSATILSWFHVAISITGYCWILSRVIEVY